MAGAADATGAPLAAPLGDVGVPPSVPAIRMPAVVEALTEAEGSEVTREWTLTRDRRRPGKQVAVLNSWAAPTTVNSTFKV